MFKRIQTSIYNFLADYAEYKQKQLAQHGYKSWY